MTIPLANPWQVEWNYHNSFRPVKLPPWCWGRSQSSQEALGCLTPGQNPAFVSEGSMTVVYTTMVTVIAEQSTWQSCPTCGHSIDKTGLRGEPRFPVAIPDLLCSLSTSCPDGHRGGKTSLAHYTPKFPGLDPIN